MTTTDLIYEKATFEQIEVLDTSDTNTVMEDTSITIRVTLLGHYFDVQVWVVDLIELDADLATKRVSDELNYKAADEAANYAKWV